MPIERISAKTTPKKMTKKITIITGIMNIPNQGMFHHSGGMGFS
jgi:hypothetical protein